jgi:threonyl-tRNA synthetase
VWLAPTQVRLVPVSDAHVEGAMRLAERLPFRVDVDDRDIKMGKKVRAAEREWIPYIIVVGERELDGGDLTVRQRLGEQLTMSLADFENLLTTETAGKPRRMLNTPRALSKRPIFVG